MKLLGVIFSLVLLFSCETEVCQECEILKESNESAVMQSLKKVNGGVVYRLEEEPFIEIENTRFISCEVNEMNRTEALDNLLEVKSFELDGVSIQYQVRWYANCRLID